MSSNYALEKDANYENDFANIVEKARSIQKPMRVAIAAADAENALAGSHGPLRLG